MKKKKKKKKKDSLAFKILFRLNTEIFEEDSNI